MKKTNSNLYQAMSGLFVFCALASGVVALCLLNRVDLLIIYILAACAAAFLLAYVITCSVATKKCEHGKSCFLLAWEIVGVSIIVIALLPLAAIMWVVESLVENARKAK